MKTDPAEMCEVVTLGGKSEGSAAQTGARVGRRTGAGNAFEKKRTESLRESLPRGIIIGERFDGRDKPWFVRFGPRRTIESFELEQSRNDRAAKLGEDLEKEGAAALSYDPAEWKAWIGLKARTGATLAQLEEAWHARPAVRAKTILVAEAVPKYIALRLAEDLKPKTDTYRHVTLHLEQRFVAAFGAKRLDELTPEMLREWFAGLTDPDTGKPMGNATKRDYRKDTNTFLKRCVDEEWLLKNPCAKVRPPKIAQQDRPPMPVRDIFELLKANRDEPVIGRLALELYGSMRASSAGRWQKEWVKWEGRRLRIPGESHKSGKSKSRQGHPDVLWDWLTHASDDCWTKIDSGNYGHKKQDAFMRAKVTNPGNGLRRSCASYQLAIAKNVGPVSYLMQHKHTSTTEIYEGEAKESDARLFMAITPDATLLTWEEFVKKTKASAAA